MRPLYEQAAALTDDVTGAAIEVHEINKAQLLSYMKLFHIPLGFIINFNVLKLTDEVSRLILPGANAGEQPSVLSVASCSQSLEPIAKL